jgi:hypothetical protein
MCLSPLASRRESKCVHVIILYLMLVQNKGRGREREIEREREGQQVRPVRVQL